jgi:signal transduction histidine kinase
LDIYTLLLAHTQVLATLQAQLLRVNLELEQRVNERTLDLQRANTQLQQEVAFHRQLQILLAKARDEAMRASQFKSDLLARVSHELRTPLTAVMGYAQLLSFGSYGELTEEQKQATEIVINSAKYLSSLVNGILDQAQIDRGQLNLNSQPFNLRPLLEDIQDRIGLLAHNKGLEFALICAPDVPDECIGDRTRVEQVLTNLLGNAVKFTSQGKVSLKVAFFPPNFLEFQIADTGPGIAAEDQARIFEPFVQLERRLTGHLSGAGLVLSISKQIIDLMKGTLKLESAIGRGSIFTIRLPIVTPASTPEITEKQLPPTHHSEEDLQ